MTERGLVALTPGALFAGRFRVEAPLAQGGMGAVYRVEQTSNGARRALKVLHPNLVNLASVREGFEREARVGAQIRSRHVVEVLDAGIDDATGMPWLAMELLQGETLDARAKRVGVLDTEEVSRIFAQLGDALGAAHDANVVHLDMKPENVFLADIALHGVRGPVVKVLDFGIARVVSTGATSAQITTAGGSPYWMAPEQAEASGGRARPATDVWALGLIAYRLVTGKIFWREAQAARGTLKRLLGEILFEPLPRASVRAAEQGAVSALPEGFDGWFAQCVERDPKARYPHARAAVEALQSVLAVGDPAPSSVPPTVLWTGTPRSPIGPIEDAGRVDPRGGTVMIAPTAVPRVPVAVEVARTMSLLEALAQAEARGEIGETVRLGEEALTLRPADEALRRRLALAYASRARTLDTLGERDRAVMDATRAMELEPLSAAHCTLRGSLRLSRGEPGPALDDLARALTLDATSAEAWAARARCYLRLDRPMDALRDIHAALERGGTVAEHWYLRGLAYGALGDAVRWQADITHAAAMGHAEAVRALRALPR